MKKFSFSLESLLGVKITLEKQQKSELGAAEARLSDLNRGLADIRLRFQIHSAEYVEKLKFGMLPYDITLYAIGFRTLRDKEKLQTEKINGAKDEIERIRLMLIETMKERKILENLRERYYSEYLEEVKRENERVIGDFVANQLATDLKGGDLDG